VNNSRRIDDATHAVALQLTDAWRRTVERHFLSERAERRGFLKATRFFAVEYRANEICHRSERGCVLVVVHQICRLSQ